MAEINFENLLSSGAHFGHVTRKWHPEFAPYILMKKNGIHIINLDETVRKLNQALTFISSIARKNGEVLFVGTKKQARDIIQQEADRCGMFYIVERWLGGTLTNYSTIKKSIKRLQLLEKEGSNIYENLTKKEIQMLNRERIKLADQHRGIKDMKRLPDVIIVVDAHHEITAVKEARLLEIPVIGIVDTNTSPHSVDYPIPANDDSIRTIQLIISAIADEILAATNKENEQEKTTSVTGMEEKSKENIETVSDVNVEEEKAAEVQVEAVKIKQDTKKSEVVKDEVKEEENADVKTELTEKNTSKEKAVVKKVKKKIVKKKKVTTEEEKAK